MLKFGPLVGMRLAMLVAEPWAPTTLSVWQPEQWSRKSTAPRWYGLSLATCTPWEPQAPRIAAHANRTSSMAATFMRGEYIDRRARRRELRSRGPCSPPAGRG